MAILIRENTEISVLGARIKLGKIEEEKVIQEKKEEVIEHPDENVLEVQDEKAPREPIADVKKAANRLDRDLINLLLKLEGRWVAFDTYISEFEGLLKDRNQRYTNLYKLLEPGVTIAALDLFSVLRKSFPTYFGGFEYRQENDGEFLLRLEPGVREIFSEISRNN